MAMQNYRYEVNGSSALKARQRVEGEYRPKVVCTRGQRSHRSVADTCCTETITYRRYISECAAEVRSALSRDAVADTHPCTLTASQLAVIGAMSFAFTLFATLV